MDPGKRKEGKKILRKEERKEWEEYIEGKNGRKEGRKERRY